MKTRKTLPNNAEAFAFVEGPHHCEICGAELDPKKVVWLELNNRTSLFNTKTKALPEAESQGFFPFGPACARRVLKSGGKHLFPRAAKAQGEE